MSVLVAMLIPPAFVSAPVLAAWSPDYDGKGKAWVRSRVER
ncbi:MAG: hypothetical protein WBB76_04730 [Gaiellaceae bacterium]